MTYGSAVISDCGSFRWRLDRTWGLGGRKLLFVMLNPSTADGEVDDHTVRKCIILAKAHGYDSLRIVNMIGYRATNPKAMYIWFLCQTAVTLRQHARVAFCEIKAHDVSAVCCAWGTPARPVRAYAEWFREQLFAMNKPLFCLKYLLGNWPGHPLYLANDTKLLRFTRDGGL